MVLASEAGLAGAYLYGSALRIRNNRDVDIALLYGPSRRRPADSRLEKIASALDKAFGKETDIHLVSELPDPVLFRVIREGARLFAADRLAVVRFESETMIRFLDFKSSYDFLTERILMRSSHG